MMRNARMRDEILIYLDITLNIAEAQMPAKSRNSRVRRQKAGEILLQSPQNPP